MVLWLCSHAGRKESALNHYRLSYERRRGSFPARTEPDASIRTAPPAPYNGESAHGGAARNVRKRKRRSEPLRSRTRRRSRPPRRLAGSVKMSCASSKPRATLRCRGRGAAPQARWGGNYHWYPLAGCAGWRNGKQPRRARPGGHPAWFARGLRVDQPAPELPGEPARTLDRDAAQGQGFRRLQPRTRPKPSSFSLPCGQSGVLRRDAQPEPVGGEH